MEKLAQILFRWEKYYYAEPVMAVMEAFTITCFFIYPRKDDTSWLFLIYLLVDLGLFFTEFLIAVSSTLTNKFIGISNVSVTSLEFISYIYFFKIVLKNKASKFLINFFIIAFAFLVIYYITELSQHFLRTTMYLPDTINIFEFLFLMPCAFIYYWELFQLKPILSLFQRPSFWITTGILIFSAISMPFYLLKNQFFSTANSYRYLFSALFFYFPFILNSLFICRAFLCRRPLII
jgi:hypothetical protein